MESPYWKTVSRIGLVVTFMAGTIAIAVNRDKTPPMYWNSIAVTAILFGVVGLILDFKPWRWRFYTAKQRDFFVGNWNCGHGNGDPETRFTMTLNEDGTVHKSHVPQEIVTWSCRNGIARVHTSDGWRDLLQPIRAGLVIKLAYDERSRPLPDSSPTNLDVATKLTETRQSGFQTVFP